MTSYQLSSLRAFLTILLGAAAPVAAYLKLFNVPPLALNREIVLGGSVVLLTLILFIYWLELDRLRASVKLYVRACTLRSAGSLEALNLAAKYHEFYLERDEDKRARECLRARAASVLITGKALSGKTRMAVEAIRHVRPGAYVLAFSSPDQLKRIDLASLLIPSLLPFRKPHVAVFFDDISNFVGSRFEDLLDRLRPQVAKLYLVATCRSGEAERVVRQDPALQGLHRDRLGPSHQVEIGPLRPEQAERLTEVMWKHAPGAVLPDDVSLAGAIVLGTGLLRRTYDDLSPDGKLAITALVLGDICGSNPCERGLLLDIIAKIFGTIGDASGALKELQQKDVIVAGEDGLALKYPWYVDHLYSVHYQTITKLKPDVLKLEAVLDAWKDAGRLRALGVFLGDRLNDYAAARHALKASKLRNPEDAEAWLILANVEVRLGNLDDARSNFEEGIARERSPERRALALLGHGDMHYHARRMPAAALPYYERAFESNVSPAIRTAAAIREGDCLLTQRDFAAAERLYRAAIGQASGVDHADVVSRLTIALMAQLRMPEARSALREYLGKADLAKKLDVAIDTLAMAEPLFPANPGPAYEVVWEEFKTSALARRTRTDRGRELAAFADQVVADGFPSVGKLACGELRKPLKKVTFSSHAEVGLSLNLGAAHLYLGEFAPAAELFRETVARTKGKAGLEAYLAGAEEGFAYAYLYDPAQRDLSKARQAYEALLKLGTDHENDTIKAWAHVGLGDVELASGAYASAEKHYRTPPRYPPSCDTETRIWLGMAKISLESKRLVDAEVYVLRGLARCERRDYARQRKEFEELKAAVASARA